MGRPFFGTDGVSGLQNAGTYSRIATAVVCRSGVSGLQNTDTYSAISVVVNKNNEKWKHVAEQ